VLHLRLHCEMASLQCFALSQCSGKCSTLKASWNSELLPPLPVLLPPLPVLLLLSTKSCYIPRRCLARKHLGSNVSPMCRQVMLMVPWHYNAAVCRVPSGLSSHNSNECVAKSRWWFPVIITPLYVGFLAALLHTTPMNVPPSHVDGSLTL